MPPVLAKRPSDDSGHLISTDPGLQGLLPSNNRLVFTDISLGQSRRNRLIVIREPNGDLRHASMAERERINGVYFPLPGRRLRVPLMFSAEHLQVSIRCFHRWVLLLLMGFPTFIFRFAVLRFSVA